VVPFDVDVAIGGAVSDTISKYFLRAELVATVYYGYFGGNVG